MFPEVSAINRERRGRATMDGERQLMLNRVLELLEKFSRRPAMFVHRLDTANVESYLNGLKMGCSFGGLYVSREIYKAAAAARGWKVRAAGIVWHMRAEKLDDAAIIQELIAVEIEAYRPAGNPG
jgi:hypothetical protein